MLDDGKNDNPDCVVRLVITLGISITAATSGGPAGLLLAGSYSKLTLNPPNVFEITLLTTYDVIVPSSTELVSNNSTSPT